jgi:hypothetical protein
MQQPCCKERDVEEKEEGGESYLAWGFNYNEEVWLVAEEALVEEMVADISC